MNRKNVVALGALGAMLGIGAIGLMGGTTPIGTATELAKWQQGWADAPLCVKGVLTDGGIGCVALIGTQDGGDVNNGLWSPVSGGIAPSPAAGVIVPAVTPGFNFHGGGIASTQTGTWGSGAAGYNFMAAGSQPEYEMIKNPYPDGGCQGGFNLSFNDSTVIEFNGVACDGSNPQTLCAFDPYGASGWDFECGINGGTVDGVRISAGFVSGSFVVPLQPAGNLDGRYEPANDGKSSAAWMTWNAYVNGVYPDGGYDWAHEGSGISRAGYVENFGTLNGQGETWGMYYLKVTGSQDVGPLSNTIIETQDGGELNTPLPVYSSWDYVDGGQPVATQAQLKAWAYTSLSGFCGSTTLSAAEYCANLTLVPQVKPTALNFVVSTAGAGAGNATLSVYDNGGATNLCTLTVPCAQGAGSLLASACASAGTSTSNNDVRIKFDDSACTVGSGPLGNATATLNFQ